MFRTLCVRIVCALALLAGAPGGAVADVLEPATRAWVQAHPVWRAGYVSGPAGVLDAGEGDSLQGLVGDRVRNAATRLGATVVPRRYADDAALSQALARGEVDLALSASRERLLAASPALLGPLWLGATLVVTRADAPLFLEPGQYAGQTVAVARSDPRGEGFRRNQPSVGLLSAHSTAEACAAVIDGRAAAALVDPAGFAACLAREGATPARLQVAGAWAGMRDEVWLAARPDWPELHALLQDALAAESPVEAARARTRWLSPPSRDGGLPGWVPGTLAALGLVAIMAGLLVFGERRVREARKGRAEAEAALARAEALARESADRKAAFLAALSHEIRTPMNGVTGLVDAVMRGRLDDNQRFQLGVIARSARMALDILNDALDYARVEAGRLTLDPRPTVVADLAEHAVSLFAPLAEERALALHLSVAAHLPPLDIDGLRVQQVLTNLLSNALRYTERGHVRVRITGAPLSTRRWRLSLEVEDTGPGIAEAARERLYRPFEPLGGPGATGTGLGLAVCHALADAMGATLELDSTSAAGSRFRFAVEADATASAAPQRPFDGVLVQVRIGDAGWHADCVAWLRHWGAQVSEQGTAGAARLLVTDTPRAEDGPCTVRLVRSGNCMVQRARDGRVDLSAQPLLPSRLRDAARAALDGPPEVAAAPAAGHALPAPPPPATPQVRRVLVVDDEPLNLRVARELLALLGYEATLTAESQAGFEAFCSERFCAVLLDYRMPGEDGISLAARMRLRERNRALTHTPILAVTADASESTASASLAAGMDQVLLKPLTLETLHDALNRLGCHPAVPPAGLRAIEPEPESDGEDDPLAHLAALLGGHDRARAIADGFVDASRDDLTALREKLEVQDFEATRFLAHRIKGGARNAGFRSVGLAAAELEAAAKSGNAEACATYTVQVTRALERLKARLAAIPAAH